MKKIYLDYAATTPVDPAVMRAMRPYFAEKFGNAGSLHAFGQEAMAALDHSRETIAAAIGAEFREVIFTGSATEANNLALRGIVKRSLPVDRSLRPRIIVSAIEHESILETVRDLEREGVEVVFVPVNEQGMVDEKMIKESLTEQTVLVSVMLANNEIGTVQPIAKIAKLIADFRERRKNSASNRIANGNFPLFHTDASQAFQFLDCNVNMLGVDMMTLSSHKIYGPKGAGALYVRRAVEKNNVSRSVFLAPLLAGGGQEFGLRSGTENIPAIVGFARAVELSAYSRELAGKNIGKLRAELWSGIKKIFPKAEVNGISPAQLLIANRFLSLPNILNVYFPGRSAEDILTRLDLAGIAASSGSACRSRALEVSYVIEALGYAKNRAAASIRFSLGRPTTKQEISVALDIMKKILK